MSAASPTTTTPNLTMRERLQAPEVTTGALLVLLVLGLTAFRPDFLAPANINDILINSAYVAIAAVGMTLVIISGAIDISIGSMLAVCAVVAGNAAQVGIPMPLVVLLTIIAGGGMGRVNGTLVALLNIPPIIVTRGMLSVYRGATILVTRGVWIRNLPDDFYLSQQVLLGVPLPIWAMLIVVALFAFLLRNTVWGREIYAVGGNKRAALLAGVNVRRTQLLVFVLNGLLVGLATIIYVTRFSVIQTNTGIGFELVVITAVVVGGTSILGGSGTIIGTFLATLLLGVLGTGLLFLQISPYWLQAVQGTLILLAVVFDILRRRSQQQ